MLTQVDVQDFEIAPNTRIANAVLAYNVRNLTIDDDGQACFCISYALQDCRREDTKTPVIYDRGTISIKDRELAVTIQAHQDAAIKQLMKTRYNYPPPPPVPEPVLDPETAAMRSAVRTLNLVLEKNPAITPETLAVYLERTFRS